MAKWVPLLIGALALAAGIAILPPDVFWITDEGTKFIQLQSGGLDVFWPGRAVDPTLRLLPDAGFHLIRLGPHIVSLFLPYWALLNAIPFRLFGIYGIYLIPAAGALITMALTRRLGGDPLLLLFATPLFFYSITYWEHSAAVALGIGAVVLLVTHRSPVAAGALLAASTLLREEGYVFTIAVLLALILRDRSPRMAMRAAFGFLVVMTPAWLWHLHLYGSILGLHAKVYAGQGGFLTSRAQATFDALLRFRPDVLTSVVLVAPQLLAIVAPKRWRNAVLLLACVTAVASPILLAREPDHVLATSSANGLLPSLPFLTVVLLAWREVDRFLGSIVLLYIAGACATLSSAGVWIIWGPRHFLPIIPLLVVLTMEAWTKLGRPRAAIVLLLAALAIQTIGITDLALKKRGTHRILDAIVADRTGVVLTDVFWLPQEMASIFEKKIFLLTKSDADAAYALATLRAHGIQRFTFVGSRDYRSLSNAALVPIVRAATRRTHVVTPGMEFMDVMVLSCDIGRALSPSGRAESPPHVTAATRTTP